MTAVLADSGPLYALAFASDQYHVQARAELERLAADRLKVMISYSTVVESHSLILRRAAPEYALTWLTTIRTTGDFIAPTEDDYVNAIQLIQRNRDQRITLADGVVAATSQRLKLPVWTYDHHFDVMRIDRWR